jgi:hypothetical protein
LPLTLLVFTRLQRTEFINKGDVRFPLNSVIKKHFNKEKKTKNIHSFIKNLEVNSYAISPEVTQVIKTNKTSQQSQPILNNKISKNIIFNRIKNRKNKDSTKAFDGRAYSAIRRSSNFQKLDISSVVIPQRIIEKKRIKSLSKKNNLSIIQNNLKPLSIDESCNPSMSISRPNSRGFASITRKIGRFWNKSPQ